MYVIISRKAHQFYFKVELKLCMHPIREQILVHRQRRHFCFASTI
jgi:hypothetical protein